MFRIITAIVITILSFAVASITHAQVTATPVLDIPAFTAYVEPDPDAMQVSQRDGVAGWTDAAQRLVWYGYIKNPGTLTPQISLTLPDGGAATLKLTVAGTSSEADVTGTGASEVTAEFKAVSVEKP